MTKIQHFYLYSYRLVGFIFLVGLIASILWYGFSILFFVGNASWSVPIILSPHQEKVMTHLEHILAFEQELTKNKAELIAANQVLQHKKTVLSINQNLLDRLGQSMTHQAIQYIKASTFFNTLNKEKKTNLTHLSQLTAELNHEEQIIDRELQLGLITKQEALLAHLNWSRILATLIDSKASMHDAKRRAKGYADAAKTLNGSGKNLRAMNRIIKKVELESHIASLKNDILNLEFTTTHLQRTIRKKTRILTFMKNSPYILATKKAITVAFIPYNNLKHAKIGSSVYSCYLDMILCYKSGYISNIYDAEEYSKHPIFKSDVKGQLLGITFADEADGQKKLLFLNSRPLFI